MAVLPVILFHAGFQAFSGGFAGVDVFFVISGYLITSILVAEHEAGTYSLVNFYERRARRILPALFFVLLACLPIAWFWLMPSEMKRFASSLVAVSGFSSNLLFWKEAGYFETATELKPLLHTWSLAVEEQYYVIFPLVLMAAWRFGKRFIIWLLLAAAIGSLALAQWASINKPEAAFYLLPTRGWELLIGALVALKLGQRTSAIPPQRHLAQLLSLAGLLMIVYAMLFFDRNTPFPGVYALVPTVGAALIIYFANQTTFAGKLLGTPVLVGVGLISYSAYLWHQPLLAFAKHRSVGAPGVFLLSELVLLTLVLAYLTWQYVEKPFRSKARVSRRQIFSYGALGTAFFIACGLAGNLRNGLETRFDPQLTTLFAPPKTQFETKCALKTFAAEPMLKQCEFGQLNGKKVFVLYGDSHAQALFSALDQELTGKGIKGIFVSSENCLIPNLFDSRVKVRSADCERSARFLYHWLSTDVDYLAVSVRWTYRLYPVPGAIDTLLFDNGENGVEHGDDQRENYTLYQGKHSTASEGKKLALHDFLGQLAASSKHMFLVYPVPEAGWDIPRKNFRTYLASGTVESAISTSFDVYKKRNLFAENALNAVGEQPNLIRIKPASLLCDTYLKNRCMVQTSQVPLYYDDDHLSNAGARLVTHEIMKSVLN